MAKCANKVWDSSVWINMNICPEICGASVLWESEFSFYFCSKSLKIDFCIRGKGGSKKKLEVVSNFCIVFSEIDPVSSNANRMQNYCHATFREVPDEKKAVVQKMQVLLQKEIISSQNIFLHDLFCLSMPPICTKNYEVFFRHPPPGLQGCQLGRVFGHMVPQDPRCAISTMLE